MKRILLIWVVIWAFILTYGIAPAQDGDIFVVISGQRVGNVVVVAKSGGQYKSVQAAMDSITDASAANPYMVVIGPGIYTISQTLVMKEYVHIVGSGENVTKLKGAISTDSPNESSAIISGADNSTLRSLTVGNEGGSGYSMALYNKNAAPTVINVTATASGGTDNYVVYNYSSSPTMTDVTAMASGGVWSVGVGNYSTSSLTMTGVTATALGGTHNFGVRNYFSSPTMTNVTATASDGTDNYGVYNYSSSPTMTDVTAMASGGTNNIGVRNGEGSFPTIRRSTMEGDTNALYTNYGTAKVSQSTIIGPVFGGFNNACVACDDGNGTPLNASCLYGW